MPEPILGTTDLRTRIRRIASLHVGHICTYLVNVGLWANHPIKCKIHEVLPVDLPLRDAVACCSFAQSVTLAVLQLDPSLASFPTRELFLIPQLGNPRRPL